MTMQAFLGIDVSKDRFDVALLCGQPVHSAQFDNTAAGFKRLTGWLRQRRQRQVWACLEATGRFSQSLAEYLHEQSHTVSVVNPLVIKAYAQSKLLRNKSDKLDALLIARFCQSERPDAWTPPGPEIKELRQLLGQYDDLQATLQQVRNRLGSGISSPLVREQLQAQEQLLQQQLKDLRQALKRHLRAHPNLQRQVALVQSIQSLGLLTASKIVAVIPQRFPDARRIAAHAGITPMNRDSGKSVHRRPKFSKIGDAELRRALYMPAVSAIRHNPVAKALYARLIARGKLPMVALGAVMHKLLRLAYGVLKSGQPFDPNYAYKMGFAS